MAAETLDAVIVGLDNVDRRGAEADDGFVGTERKLGATDPNWVLARVEPATA